MPLVVETLKQDLISVFESGRDNNDDIEKVADGIANAIDAYIKTGTVTTSVNTSVAPGILVQTVPATGTGSTTSPGVGTGSGTGSIS